MASWVGSIPMHSRHVGLAYLALAFAGIHPACAQRADSARVAPTRLAPKDSVKPRGGVDTAARLDIQPPLSPARAFFYSALLPGYAQSRLGRPLAGGLFMLTESIALGMLRESYAELKQARNFRSDSLMNIGNDPTTGTPVLQPSSFNDELISIRKGRIEDWIAFLVGNHLIAGADAYVAAHLYDLPAQISVAQTRAGPAIVASVRW